MYWFVVLTFTNKTKNSVLSVEVAEEDKKKIIDLYEAVYIEDDWVLDVEIKNY